MVQLSRWGIPLRPRRPLLVGGREISIGELLEFREYNRKQQRLNPERVAQKLLAKYGFTRDTPMLTGIDVDFLVRPKQ